VSRIAVRASVAFDGRAMIPGGALVLCDGGKIAGVLPGGAPAPDGWPVEEFPGGAVLPGLIDCHVHLCGDSRSEALDRLAGYADDELSAVIEAGLRAHLAAGVTTVRDLGDRRGAVLDWRAHAAAGSPMPAIVAAGPPITTPGGHCWYMGGEAGDLAALRAAVRDRAERGADVVKIMASGGAMTAGTDVLACQYTVEQLRTVVEAAHSFGLPVTMHAHALTAVAMAVDAGADGIEHCSCVTGNGVVVEAALLERLAATRVTVCPTLGRKMTGPPPPQVAELMRRLGLTWEDRLTLVGAMHRAGVVIASGVDAGISPGKPHGSLPGAIGDLVDAGIPAVGALASATSVAAAACGLGDTKGWLRDGFDADLAVVGGDPSADIGALGDVRAVYLRGTRAV
jgi:imidazolonepropionase-like amidohydrolase